ncbi:MAG: lipoprotein insertase outer membrane protein LolB [Steroidobacteraceae bacterium]|jgi:outer membrane lipoprotein LolB
MRRLILLVASGAVIAGCATFHPETRPPTAAAVSWDERRKDLEQATRWDLDGRAAVALGQQGWQASLNWRQTGTDSELHLAGPLGVGALMIKVTPAGLSLNGAPPSAAVVAQLQDRLGFALPLDNLRYWLLGIPDPNTPFELTRNAQDRAAHLSQAGWSIDYADYMAGNGDLLPKRLVLTRADARVRIAVDRWEGPK